MAQAKQSNSLGIIVRSLKYLRPYWKMTLGAYCTAIGIAALGALTPQLIRWIVDTGITDRQPDALRLGVLGLLGLTFIKGIMVFWQGYWSEQASQTVAYDLRNAIHEKLVELSFSYHDRAETGQLLSRSIQDVERIRFLTGRAILQLFQINLLFIGTFIVLMLMNSRLALLSLATMPLLVYVALRFGSVFRPLSLEIQNQMAVLTTKLEQNLRGTRIVKAFAQEKQEEVRFERENQHWFSLSSRAARMQSGNIPLIDMIASFSTVLIIWYGGRLVIQRDLTLGELVAFTTYLGQLVSPMRRVGMIIPAVVIAASSGERIFEILDTSSEVQEAPNAIDLPPIQGHVRFEDVSFSYLGRRNILTHINLEAKSGQIIALLGMTGSGKTTIINLIPRFYDPTEGCITIDGIDIRQVTLDSLRDQIGIVLQETRLFATSIRENIAFGSPDDVTEDAIIAAAQAAQAHHFITQTPHGYETEVGERGIMLSGGQKQRIAIARALLKNPRILLLDDATSSVDTETERQIQIALQNLMAGRTSFVIAQRLSTVRLADQVLVLNKGAIVARGTHEELLRESGLYAEIYHQQLRD